MSETPVVYNLLIANVVAYLATMLLDTNQMYALFALFPIGSPFFEVWQPITYMFLHGDFSHLFFNMFALWMFGRGLEAEMGTKRWLRIFIAGQQHLLRHFGNCASEHKTYERNDSITQERLPAVEIPFRPQAAFPAFVRQGSDASPDAGTQFPILCRIRRGKECDDNADRSERNIHYQMVCTGVQSGTWSVPQSEQGRIRKLSLHRCIRQCTMEESFCLPEDGQP